MQTMRSLRVLAWLVGIPAALLFLLFALFLAEFDKAPILLGMAISVPSIAFASAAVLMASRSLKTREPRPIVVGLLIAAAIITLIPALLYAGT